MSNDASAIAFKAMAAVVHAPFFEVAPFVLTAPSAIQVFSIEDAQRMFRDQSHRRANIYDDHEALSLILDEAIVDRKKFDDYDAALALKQHGASVLFRCLGKYVPATWQACQVLADIVRLPVHVNAFWSPPSAQALPLHSDSDTVFATQVSGIKRWLLFKPDEVSSEAARTGNSWIYEKGNTQQAFPPATADYSFVVESGQVLVVPRGWRHYALTDDSESLHLSFGALHKEIDPGVVERQFPAWPS